MKQNEIIENNKLIAKFMEKNNIYIEFERYVNRYGDIEYSEYFDNDELLYHISWDWLIPVINKITSMDIYFKYKDDLNSQFNDGGIEINVKYIEVTYESVIDFIKWYNKQNK